MIGISPAIFAASLIAVAAAASSPVVDRAAPLTLFQARGSGLHARQNLQYPDSCIPSCQPIFQIIGACTDAKCACTTENENALVDCLDCAVAAVSSSANVQDAQAQLKSYRESCATNGVALSSPTTLNPSLTLNSATGTTSATSTSTSTTTTSSTTPATTSQSKSGAIGIRGRAEVLSMLFSLCLMAVLLV